ncbi:MAG: phage terminase large subunit [Ignavibacterium sp.]|nr:phage terminase large subunit [Ignavibacterium sp.]
MKIVDLELQYHRNQEKIFFESDARYKVIAKGRRFGLTKGFANYVIEQMLNGVSPVLWVDTIYGNIERYVERYFIPVLRKLPRKYWKYRANRTELRIGNSVCDFRSADNPENIEGFGYALIVINEAGIVLKNRALWNESILPMILDYKANVLIGGTPKGKVVKRSKEKHLFFELYERRSPLLNPPPKGEETGNTQTEKYSEWQSFNFSSYDNPLIDPNDIDELVTQISPALRDQEIYGKFIDKESSGIIKRDWWRYYDDEASLTRQRVFKKVQSWDTAFKKNQENDYSVCTTWMVCESGYYLLDLWKGRVEFPELKRKVVELHKLHSANEILIEDKASGQSLIQELQRDTALPIKPIKVVEDKIARVHSVTPLIEAGKVFLPQNRHWLSEFINECEEFPNGEFDDVVDSVSQFLNNVKTSNHSDYKGIIHIPRGKIKTKYYKYRKPHP